MYLWETSSGLLLRVWEGHYKKVNSIAFTDDDSLMISGGEDGIINAWNMAHVLDEAASSENSQSSSIIKPLFTWSQHSLPVTHVYCGVGGVCARVVSTSLDRTCKLWDLSTGSLVCSVVFPTSLTCAILDPSEHAVYVGGLDGIVYVVHLFNLASISDHTVNARENSQQVFKAHTKSVSCLSMSFDGSVLVSGSIDGTCIVWDVVSRQPLRTFAQHKGPVTGLFIIPRPADIADTSTSTAPSSSERKSQRSLQTFKKFPYTHDKSVATARTLTLQLKYVNNELAHSGVLKGSTSGLLSSYKRKHDAVVSEQKVDTIEERQQLLDQTVDKLLCVSDVSGEGALHKQVVSLEQELTHLQEQNNKWKKINNELYSFAVKGVGASSGAKQTTKTSRK